MYCKLLRKKQTKQKNRDVLDELEKGLKPKKNVKYFFRLDGSTRPQKRQEFVETFQKVDNSVDGECRIGLISITAGGQGITLHQANIVVFCELYWTPAMLLQCEDRVHRIGQKAQCVNISYVIGRNTIDEYVCKYFFL